MRKLWVCVFLAVVCASTTAQFDDDWDLWNNEYDSVYDSDTLAETAEKHSNENVVPDNDDKKVQDEINNFREANDAAEEKDDLSDYQFEDNRSKDKEDTPLSEEEPKTDDLDEDIETFEVKDVPENNDDVIEDQLHEVPEEIEENDGENFADDYALLWGDRQEEQALNEIKEDERRVIDETKAILEQEENVNNDFDENNVVDSDVEDSVVEETKKILDEIDNDFDNDEGIKESDDFDNTGEEKEDIVVPNDNYAATIDKLLEEVDSFDDIVEDSKEEQSENFDDEDKETQGQEDEQADLVVAKEDFEDTIDEEIVPEKDSLIEENAEDEEVSVDKAYADLNADLDQLFETLDKLSSDDEEKDNVNEEEAEDNKSSNFDEEKFHDALNMNPLDYEEKYGIPYRETLTLKMREQNEEFNDYGDDLDGVDEEHDSTEEEANFEELFNDKINATEKEQVVYGNDAFVAKDEPQAIIDSNDTETENVDSENKDPITPKVDVDELSSDEVSELMEQFTALHKEDLDSESDDFDKHVAPVHITLTVGEPVVVTSPNYPEPYPTGNIIDWIFEGQGVGIELNITDLAINGALGDYLLVKPGGIDESGQDGLVFSYRLSSERRYRFMDVDRMFVRFDAKSGVASYKGFQFSVRMISPLPEEPEPIPEPEAVLIPPKETLTLNLGGISVVHFQTIQEEFRTLIADMATEYIAANNINQGLNTTFEITQITRSVACNMHWPESETCTEVTFGVPLTYEEDADPRLTSDDLEDMWRTYIKRDPYALRLERLGITEFAIPDERSVLAVWLVIAAGVFISMAMLGLALWRFSCFEDYTRMKAYSDTDSMHNEKRNLDLYPTPHQTLPPLYADTEYKWVDDDSTRVDMGGFANKSYNREMYDFDSDEDVITPRDRVAKEPNFFDA